METHVKLIDKRAIGLVLLSAIAAAFVGLVGVGQDPGEPQRWEARVPGRPQGIAWMNDSPIASTSRGLYQLSRHGAITLLAGSISCATPDSGGNRILLYRRRQSPDGQGEILSLDSGYGNTPPRLVDSTVWPMRMQCVGGRESMLVYDRGGDIVACPISGIARGDERGAPTRLIERVHLDQYLRAPSISFQGDVAAILGGDDMSADEVVVQDHSSRKLAYFRHGSKSYRAGSWFEWIPMSESVVVEAWPSVVDPSESCPTRVVRWSWKSGTVVELGRGVRPAACPVGGRVASICHGWITVWDIDGQAVFKSQLSNWHAAMDWEFLDQGGCIAWRSDGSGLALIAAGRGGSSVVTVFNFASK